MIDERALAEPPVWGSFDLPLVPPQLAAIGAAISVPRRSVGTSRRRPTNQTLRDLCSGNWTIPADWKLTAIDFADHHASVAFASALLDPRLDVPLVPVRIADVDHLSDIPLLESTWRKIAERGITCERLASLLAAGSFVDAVEILGSVPAAFDLSITASSWLGKSGRVAKTYCPVDLTEALQLAKFRRVRQVSPIAVSSVEEFGRLALITGRAGAHPMNLDGETRTLEEIGSMLSLTRERVRQLEFKHGLKHEIIRRWPLPKVLRELKSVIDDSEGILEAELDNRLRSRWPEFGARPSVAAISLLHHYGHPPLLTPHRGVLRTPKQAVDLPISRGELRRLASQISGPMGFVRADDVRDAALEIAPEIDPDVLLREVNDVATIDGLPLGYLFVKSPARSTFSGTVHRMLGCTNPLPIEVIRAGLERRSIFRKLSPPPPTEVLLATLARIEQFEVNGDWVESLTPTPPDPDSALEWTVRKIKESPFKCLHRSSLLEAARIEGMRVGTIGIYIGYAEQFTKLPFGCVGIVGQTPDPVLVEMAREQARLLTVPSSISIKDSGTSTTIHLLVGSNVLDSGTLTARKSIRTRVGLDRYPVFAGGEHHGHMAISSANLYGLISAFSALNVMVGDSIEIVIDYQRRQVTVDFTTDDGTDPDEED